MNPLFAKRSRLLSTLFALAIATLFWGCESALSDIDITDPGVLITNFSVDRAMQDDGTILSSLSATILDKNLGSVELKNGQVKVNGEQMSPTELLNITTYRLPGATVNVNTDYTFQVVLSNGQSYSGTVTTPEKTFTALTVPSSSTADSDLPISWRDAYVYDNFIINLNLTSASGIVEGPTFNLTPEQMEAGSYVIPKSSFSVVEGITSVTVRLTGVKYGTIDPKFRTGSGTISRMTVEKTVAFN